MPPLELGVHEADAPSHQLYLTCDELDATMADPAERGVEFSQPVPEFSWGRFTAIRLPGGSELGLYEPRHAQPRPSPTSEDV